MRYKLRFVIISLLLLVSVIFILGYFWLPSPKSIDKGSFSSLRAARDIEVISREPHSLDNPEERDKVRRYLAERLTEIGYKIQTEFYDTIGNVYASLSPLNFNDTGRCTYVLLMAHLDSRHAYKVNGVTHYSLGAADDGYGLGVILELAANALKYRDNWNQGVKIIFTDGEEKGLYGIKAALNFKEEFFHNVGLIINIEARGIKGPALLFETSPGNSRIVELFKKASIPAGYSFSSYVYGILPNYTDFSLIKDDYPGMNFAVIDNLDFYHTEYDNYDNISLSSIQHYGEQIAPVIQSYLTQLKYSDLDYLREGSDIIYFSIPIIGLVSLSKHVYITFNIIVLISYIINLVIVIRRKSISSGKFFRGMLFISGMFFLAAIIGHGFSYILSVINGVNYKFIALAHLKYDSALVLISLIILIGTYAWLYSRIIASKWSEILELQLSAELFLITLAFISILLTNENFFILIPIVFSIISRWSPHSGWKWIVITTLSILLLLITVPFIHTVYLALYNGALSIVLILCFVVLVALLPHIHRVSLKLVK